MRTKRDNSTLRQKISLRLSALSALDEVRVTETHGGFGRIYARCYSQIAGGVVFEKDESKAEVLALQRPTWSVYQVDCVEALASGVGFHHRPNFFDVDPHGQCWPVVDAVFASLREPQPRMVIVATCGLRQTLQINGGWRVQSLSAIVSRRGNRDLYSDYLDVCRELLCEKAASRGYQISRWAGYYCGHSKQMTHFAAVLDIA